MVGLFCLGHYKSFHAHALPQIRINLFCNSNALKGLSLLVFTLINRPVAVTRSTQHLGLTASLDSTNAVMISVISCHIHPPDMDVTFTCLNTICKRQKTGLLNVVSGGLIGRLLPGVLTFSPFWNRQYCRLRNLRCLQEGVLYSGLWC